jgi:hypothetical protein
MIDDVHSILKHRSAPKVDVKLKYALTIRPI